MATKTYKTLSGETLYDDGNGIYAKQVVAAPPKKKKQEQAAPKTSAQKVVEYLTKPQNTAAQYKDFLAPVHKVQPQESGGVVGAIKGVLENGILGTLEGKRAPATKPLKQMSKAEFEQYVKNQTNFVMGASGGLENKAAKGGLGILKALAKKVPKVGVQVAEDAAPVVEKAASIVPPVKKPQLALPEGTREPFVASNQGRFSIVKPPGYQEPVLRPDFSPEYGGRVGGAVTNPVESIAPDFNPATAITPQQRLVQQLKEAAAKEKSPTATSVVGEVAPTATPTVTPKVKASANSGSNFTTTKFYDEGTSATRYERVIKPDKINTTADVQALHDGISREYEQYFQDVKGGRKPNVVVQKQAEALGWDYETVKSLPEGALLNDAQMTATRQISADLLLQLDKKATELAANPSTALRDEVTDIYNKIIHTQSVVKTSETGLGRAIQAKKIELIPKTFDYDSVAKTLEEHGIGQGQITDIKSALGAAEKLQKDPTLWSRFMDVLNLPKALQSAADMSALLRQDIVAASRHPLKTAKAIPSALVKPFFSEGAFEAVNKEIASRPNFGLMVQFKLPLSDIGENATAREEAFISRIAGKLPWVKAADRSFTGFLNRARADYFDDIVSNLRKAGYTPENNPKAFADAAKFVGTATGRGDLGVLAKATEELNAAFYSPRLMKSRIDMLNPVYYARLEKPVRIEAAKALLSMMSYGLGVIALGKAAGAKVEVDPRSSDFGKMRFGNVRLDPWGGFQQYARFAAQFVSGETKSTKTGQIYKLGEGYKPRTRLDLATSFLSSKESPGVGIAQDLLSGTNAIGEKQDVQTVAMNRLLPLYVQDLSDAYNEMGPKGIALSAPAAWFGMGSQAYNPYERGGLFGEEVLPKKSWKELSPMFQDAGYFPGFPSETQRGKKLSKTEYNTFLQKQGLIAANNLIKAKASAAYKKGDSEQKQAIIKAVISNSRKEALDKMFGETAKQTAQEKQRESERKALYKSLFKQ